MAAACPTGLPHPRHGRAVAVGPYLRIRQENLAYFAANICYLYLATFYNLYLTHYNKKCLTLHASHGLLLTL